jgi:hypothetical protein
LFQGHLKKFGGQTALVPTKQSNAYSDAFAYKKDKVKFVVVQKIKLFEKELVINVRHI